MVESGVPVPGRGCHDEALAVLGLLALGDLSDQHNFQPLPGAYPSITNKTFIKLCVDAHNKHRSTVDPSVSNMLYMGADTKMRGWLWTMLWLIRDVNGWTKFQPVDYPQITNQTFIKQYVDAHNKHRSEVKPSASNMLYMTWDLALARTARAWGKRCIFLPNYFVEHNEGGHPDPKFNPPGENIWIANAGRKPFDPTLFIKSWYSEVAFYQYHNNTCKGKCSHYTQVVWDTSYKIGCAIVFCRKLGRHRNVENFVCNYAPRGNAPRHPYKTGEPCSACREGDTCENNLCIYNISPPPSPGNPRRDNIKRYTRWFPPWEGRIVCDKSCVAVAVLRPSLMFLAFGVAFYLHRRDPDLCLQN